MTSLPQEDALTAVRSAGHTDVRLVKRNGSGLNFFGGMTPT